MMFIRGDFMSLGSRSNDERSGDSREGVPPGAPRWITRELIDLTIRVWQPYYKSMLSADDALAMILDVGRLYGALSPGRAS